MEHSVVCLYAASVRFSPILRGLIHLLRMRLIKIRSQDNFVKGNSLVTCDEKRMKQNRFETTHDSSLSLIIKEAMLVVIEGGFNVGTSGGSVAEWLACNVFQVGCHHFPPVMAAYRRVYDSRHPQAGCQEPGSAPEPYAR